MSKSLRLLFLRSSIFMVPVRISSSICSFCSFGNHFTSRNGCNTEANISLFATGSKCQDFLKILFWFFQWHLVDSCSIVDFPSYDSWRYIEFLVVQLTNNYSKCFLNLQSVFILCYWPWRVHIFTQKVNFTFSKFKR